MKNRQIIDILHITLLEVEGDVEPLREEMQRIQRFGLGFGYWWDVRGAREGLVAREVAAGVLEDDSVGVGWGAGLVEEEGAEVVGLVWVAESVSIIIVIQLIGMS